MTTRRDDHTLRDEAVELDGRVLAAVAGGGPSEVPSPPAPPVPTPLPTISIVTDPHDFVEIASPTSTSLRTR